MQLLQAQSAPSMGEMSIEVHTTGKPAVPRRAVILSLLLLVFTSILAMDMSRRRTKQTYVKRVRPEEWDISFRPPRGFVQGEMKSTEIGQAVPFQFELQPDIKIELAVWRLPIQRGTNPIEPGQSLMRWMHAQSSMSLLKLLRLGHPPTEPQESKLGNFDAYEIFDPRISTVVRVGKFSSDQAYGVSMKIQGMPLERALYSLFERTCRTIKLEFD